MTEACKWEKLRRVRYGDLLRLFRHRWGRTLPDGDDGAREDFFELMQLISLAPAGSDEKMANAIEIWAPWMPEWEAEKYIEHLNSVPQYQRTRTARELGKMLNLTNADREKYGLWSILPIDMTDEQLAEQRKAKDRQRKAKRRQQRGIRTRVEYLAELATRPRPWEDEGISRRAWQKRQRKLVREVCPDSSPGESSTILCKAENNLANQKRVETQRRGLQERGEPKSPRKDTKEGEVERQAPQGLSALRTHPANDERLIALDNWGKNAEKK